MRLFLFPLLLACSATPVAAQHDTVYRIGVSGTIDGGMAPYVSRALRQAEVSGAAAVYLDINTPGGRVDAAEAIVDAIRATRIPVYAFVNPRAYSAGALISIATDGIFMRSGAVLGAATPVDGHGVKLPEKYLSAMRAEFRALAEANGLDPQIAQAMVDDSVGVPGLLPPGKLLTLSTDEAIRVGFARGRVNSEKELLMAIGFPDAQVVNVGLNWAESLVRFFTNPLVAPLLLSLGILGLVFEVKAGAFGLGGLLSLLSLGLFFGAHYLVGLAGLEEVILLIAGLVSIAIEVFLLPGFGVAGVLGMVLLGAAAVMAMLGPSPSWTDVAQSLAVLGATLVLTLAVLVTWIRHLPHSTRFRGLFLQGGPGAVEGYIAAIPRHDLIGQDGVAVTDLRPAGTVAVGNERIDVVTEGDYIKAGSTVRFVRAEGYRHVVRAS